MSDLQMAKAYAVYEAIYGQTERPPNDEDITREQLSALHHLLTNNQCPYVDFAIWRPHGQRMLRKVKLMAELMDSDDNRHKLEIYGPSTFNMWLACWNPFQHGLAMLEAVDLGRLVAYRRHMERAHERFGKEVRPLLY